ncbi:MAG: MarR family transcriptional regulator [Flavobacteriales bacterium]|nr:MarR family transcriptional regulator [Flavobacteriales bacterium]
MKREETIDFQVKALWHSIARMYNEEAEKYGGTLTIAYVLLNVDSEGTPSTMLGPRIGMEPTSLSRTLKNMEEKGLIDRKPNPADGRGVLVSLTREGKRKRQVSKDAVVNFNERVRTVVPDADMKAFFKVMDAIQTLINEKQIHLTDA